MGSFQVVLKQQLQSNCSSLLWRTNSSTRPKQRFLAFERLLVFNRFFRLEKTNNRLRLVQRKEFHQKEKEFYQDKFHGQILGSAGLVLFSCGILTFNDMHQTKDNSIPRAVKAEALYQDTTYSREKLYDFLQQCNSDDPNQVGILWRLARASYDLSEEPSTSKEQKKKYIYEAFETIQKALEISEDDFAVHKWYGIILSSIGEFEGPKVSIKNAYIIKQHWLKAVQLNPRDATSLHLLGRWAFNIAGISWMERKIASAIFGTPPEASYKEALEQFLLSESISPGYWKKNALMIAQCYIKLKDMQSAKEWLEKALVYPIKTTEDEGAHQEVTQLLSKHF